MTIAIETVGISAWDADARAGLRGEYAVKGAPYGETMAPEWFAYEDEAVAYARRLIADLEGMEYVTSWGTAYVDTSSIRVVRYVDECTDAAMADIIDSEAPTPVPTPVPAILPLDSRGVNHWAAIARQYQERTAEAARTDVFVLDMFPDRYRARYARTESGEGGVIVNPRWPDGCPLTLDELAYPEQGHVDHTPGGE